MELERRRFIQLSLSTSAGLLGGMALAPGRLFGQTAAGLHPALVSPGCRRSKVKVAKIYVGSPEPHWPNPKLDLNEEVKTFESHFDRMKDEFRDVEFTVNRLATSVDEVKKYRKEMEEADGVLVIKLTIWTRDLTREALATRKPIALFALPYSGHEWVGYGKLQEQEQGELAEFYLTSDYDQLAAAVRPFRAIHHLREAKILNVTTSRYWEDYVNAVKAKFGTEVVTLGRDRVIDMYNTISDDAAKAETERWISNAVMVVEPDREEIFKSCKLALALEKLLHEEDATVITVDCYGSMYGKLPAFPCVGFTRLNDLGFGGICESDLQSAMTHVIFQGLVGKPGFISDPTMDVSKNAAILAHCLGTTRMNGPEQDGEPYRLRTIMERQEGCVPQVIMRIGQKVTQAKLLNDKEIVFFTGTIIDIPDTKRGCRTKVTVEIDGDAEELWKNWDHGLHRVTCYGDLTEDLERLCRYEQLTLTREV